MLLVLVLVLVLVLLLLLLLLPLLLLLLLLLLRPFDNGNVFATTILFGRWSASAMVLACDVGTAVRQPLGRFASFPAGCHEVPGRAHPALLFLLLFLRTRLETVPPLLVLVSLLRQPSVRRL